MHRKLKATGLALITALALGAVAAQGASAHVFNAGSDPVHLTGEQETGQVNELFLTGSGARTECEVAKYSGTAENLPAESVTVHPTYEGCTTFSLGEEIPTTVNTEGCNFILEGATDGNGHAAAEIDCEAGHQITVDNEGLCTLTIGKTEGADTPIPTAGGVHYTTTTNPNTGKEDVTVQATLTGIHYDAHGPLCFLIAETEWNGPETWHGADLDIVSSITFQGYSDAAHTEPTDFTVE